MLWWTEFQYKYEIGTVIRVDDIRVDKKVIQVPFLLGTFTESFQHTSIVIKLINNYFCAKYSWQGLF